MNDESLKPGEELIDDLDQLRELLNDLVDRLERSGVERTNGLRKTLGRDCVYYRKSMDLFLHKDYVDLRNLIESIHKQFLLVEGKK